MSGEVQQGSIVDEENDASMVLHGQKSGFLMGSENILMSTMGGVKELEACIVVGARGK